MENVFYVVMGPYIYIYESRMLSKRTVSQDMLLRGFFSLVVVGRLYSYPPVMSTSPTLRRLVHSYDCPSAIEATLKNVIQWLITQN